MILEGITMVLLVAMFGTVMLGVFDRFVLTLGLAWTEELARFLLIWTSLLAAAVAARRNRHFRVEVVAERLGRAGRIATAVVGLACLAVVVWYGWRIASFFHFQTSPGLGLPMSWIYASVVVAGAFMAGFLVRDLVLALRVRDGGRD